MPGVTVYPVFMAMPGDLQAQSAAVLTPFSYTVAMPDLTYLVPAGELSTIGSEYSRRSELEMLAVWEQARSLVDNAPEADKQLAKTEAESLLQQFSLSRLLIFDPLTVRGVTWCHEQYGSRRTRRPALADFYMVDMFGSVAPDRLHTIYKGIVPYLIWPSDSGGEGSSAIDYLLKDLEPKTRGALIKKVSDSHTFLNLLGKQFVICGPY